MIALLLAGTGIACICCAILCSLVWAITRLAVMDLLSDVLLVAGNLLLGFGALAGGDIAWGVVSIAIAGFVAWAAWRRWRRRRDRAPRSLGAKSRARIAALVRKAREAAKPRPVLRPVPGGAA